ncbi:MAG: hypothetical protein HYX68_14285 [Planctomycetes bacterium]|nr:hypothetical protein [Planctomycetota bacterium]
MPVSVTCQCGAKLEIDEKFLGKEVLCPDCQRPLPTKAPAAPPPLELPDHKRTSGLAVLSLSLSLVGAFLGGGIAGIVVGLFAIKEIAAKPGKLQGLNLARAGIITGAVGTFLLLASLVSPYVFGVDEFLRLLTYGRGVNRNLKDPIVVPVGNGEISLKRPSSGRWGIYTPPIRQNTAFQSDPLLLINTADDAFIACQDIDINLDDRNEATLMAKVLDRVRKSALLNIVGGLGRNEAPEPTVVEKKALTPEGLQEIILDIRLGGHERRLLVQYSTKDRIKAFIRVGCARRSLFERVEKDFREAFAEFRAMI